MFLYDASKYQIGNVFSILRKSDPTMPLTGLLLRVAGNVIILKQYLEFYENGYLLLNQHDVAEIIKGDYEEKFQSIIEAENRAVINHDFSLLDKITDWQSIFQLIYDEGIICSYERDGEIHLGKMVGVSKLEISVICFREDFKVEKKPYKLAINEISAVQMGSEYIRIYQKYSH